MTNRLVIGFDARMVYYRQAGIGQYILNLLRELATLQSEQSGQTKGGDFALEVLQSRKEPRPPQEWLDAAQLQGIAPTLTMRKLWTPPHHRFEQIALPLELLRSGVSVLHSPDFIPPLRRWSMQGRRPKPIKSVITIHDLAFLHFPHLLTDESRRYYGQIKAAAKSAEAIIAVSHSTAHDIMEQLDLTPDKIHVVYEAANPLFRPLAAPELAKLENAKLKEANLLAPEAEFILFVGTIEPRKNLITLLKAFRQMLDNQASHSSQFSSHSERSEESQTLRPAQNDKIKLVIAGNKGWLFDDIYRTAQELRLEPHLIWLGGVSTEELLWLYNKAAFLVMPSLYEGFGLPPLEALACGTPVLVADTSSLPEIVGEIGIKIPPQEVTAWVNALSATWQDRHRLKAEMRERGVARARQFSWRKAAEQTLAVYKLL